MSNTRKLFSVLIIFILLTLTFTTPARAFDGRSGDQVVIPSGEIINDDLYVGANSFTMDGTVNGDVVAFAQMVTINGTINGDFMSGAQTVVVNGTVTGDIRMAGSVLFLGEKAKVGGDIVSAGYSLEVRKGSGIGRDLVFAGGQILLAGDVTRNALVATGSFEIDGAIGGNVKAEVGEADQTQAGPPPSMFAPQSTIPIPLVKPGLTIDPAAKIGGDLEYTQTRDLNFPGGVVAGKITRTEPPADETRSQPNVQETVSKKVMNWTFDLVRSLVTIVLIGLFMLWLFPIFTKGLSGKLQTQPWHSFGWGLVAYAAFFFALLLIIFVMILTAILFGYLTLGSLSGTVIWVGILALFALILGFVLVTSFVAKIIFGHAVGKWILTSAKSPLAEHKYWPMVIGVSITIAVIALLSFPLIPGFLGWLMNLVIIFFGLGALWMWGREQFAKKPVAS